ncbi:MAG: hypothetical protein VB086_12620 [Clostridiaceae bacterium]|nr:hypothetical protein [Clostridiaceae bacterium]
MRKRLLPALICLILMTAFCGCRKDTRDPDWVRAEDADKAVQFWNYYISDGTLYSSTYKIWENDAAWMISYSAKTGELSTGSTEGTRYDGTLMVSRLPELAAAIDDWMQSEDGERASDYNVSFLPPKIAYEADNGSVVRAGEGVRGLGIYSLSDGEIAALSGEYTGSEEYGAISIQFPTGGDCWYIAVDD